MRLPGWGGVWGEVGVGGGGDDDVRGCYDPVLVVPNLLELV
jgi:hypothetical protein